MRDAKQARIRGMVLFAGCGSEDARWIAGHADEIDVPAGGVLAHEGDRARELLVVVQGVATDGSVVFGPGSCIGAEGLLTGRRHRADVTAVGDVRVLVFGVGAFRGLVNRLPATAAALNAMLPAPQESLRLRAVS